MAFYVVRIVLIVRFVNVCVLESSSFKVRQGNGYIKYLKIVGIACIVSHLVHCNVSMFHKKLSDGYAHLVKSINRFGLL